VVISTGEKYKYETDFEAGGLYGLNLTRLYRSNYVGGQMFGRGWSTPFDGMMMWVKPANPKTCIPTEEVPCPPESITIPWPDGTKDIYVPVDGSPDPSLYRVYGDPAAGEISYEVGASQLRRRGKIYHFNSWNYLIAVTLENGVPLYTLSPDNSGRTQQITNARGQTVVLTWTNGRVTQIKDPKGQFWTYGYNANGMLTTVTSPGGAEVRTYFYESPYGTELLTGRRHLWAGMRWGASRADQQAV
jgi:YD repeat-containing protein